MKQKNEAEYKSAQRLTPSDLSRKFFRKDFHVWDLALKMWEILFMMCPAFFLENQEVHP